MELIPKPFSIEKMVTTIDSLMRNRMEDKNIRFHIDTRIHDAYIDADEMRLEQILINILGNAVKFTPQYGSVTMRVDQTEAGAGRITTTFEVEDTGCGMSEEFQKKIFDSFSQEQNTASTGVRGTGLGMSISSILAKQMGGTLSVRSKLGEGSCFTFTVTADVADPVPESLPENIARPAGEGKLLKVLVAEDNELNAEILMEMLNAAGFAAIHASDGGQAVEMFKSSAINEFDIILMDVQMPVKNGYEATKIIRRLNRPDAGTVIIYACTANTFKEEQDRALESGLNGFISKPIDVKKLMEELNKNEKMISRAVLTRKMRRTSYLKAILIWRDTFIQAVWFL